MGERTILVKILRNSMKSFLTTLFSLCFLFSQELTMELQTITPQGAQIENTYLGKDFAYLKTNFFAFFLDTKKGVVYVVNSKDKELVKFDEALLMRFQQMKAMAGKINISNTDKTSDIKGLKATEYKVSNEGGMAIISGKIYIAKIDLLQDEKYKALQNIKLMMNPLLEEAANLGGQIVKSTVSVEMGQGMPMDIETILAKYETSIDQAILDEVKAIREYNIVESKSPQTSPKKQ